MKKQIIISWIIISLLLAAACATVPKKSTPGLYVSGWPSFSVSYPSHWLEKTPDNRVVMFMAEAPDGFSSLRIALFPNMNMPLEYSMRIYMPELAKIGKHIKVIYDKEVKLKDGTPAQEAELKWELNSGIKLKSLFLTVKKDDTWILVAPSITEGGIGEDLRKIAYSLKIKPGKEELVKVPSDIQEFLDQFCRDIVSHNMEKVMLHYSDQFLNHGNSKTEVEGIWKRYLLTIPSCKISTTGFEFQGDKAHLAGFTTYNNRKSPLRTSPIVKENGKWKWFGNQKQKQPAVSAFTSQKLD